MRVPSACEIRRTPRYTGRQGAEEAKVAYQRHESSVVAAAGAGVAEGRSVDRDPESGYSEQLEG